ncbi:MAG: hypothetical protein ACR2IE_15800 [Candidatus Sumerlaeaceae bacterium]
MQPRGRWLCHPAFLFVLSLLLTIVLYAPTLKAFLIWDDVAILPIVSTPGITGWLRCIQPVDNGFIRPATLLLFKICYSLAGTVPVYYHVSALLIHALVATVTGLLAMRLVPTRNWIGLLACLMLTTHFGAFGIASQLSNSCDSIAALGILLAVLYWDKWLAEAGRVSLWPVWVGFVIALAGKELGVVTPAVLFLFTVGRRALDRRSVRALLRLGVAAGAYLALNLWLQVTAKISYVNIGEIKISSGGVLPRFLNYVANSYLPFLTVLDWPLPHFHTTGSGLRIVRRASAALLIISIVASLVRTRYRLPACMVLCAAVVLLPVAPLHSFPMPRFIYSALPFTILAMLTYLALARVPIRSAGIVLLLQLWLVFIWSVRWSPNTLHFLRTSRAWKKFVSEVGRESAAWAPGSTITVYTNFDHRGRKHISTPYGLALFRVFYPNLLADYVSNKVLPRTTHQYRFDGHKLTPVTDDDKTTASGQNPQ